MKHIVQKVDATFLDLSLTTLLLDHVVRHHINNEAMVSVEKASNHHLFP